MVPPRGSGGKPGEAAENEITELLSAFDGPLFTAIETDSGTQLGRRLKTVARATPLGIWLESEPFDVTTAEPITLRIYHDEAGGSPVYSVHREDGVQEGTCLSLEWSLVGK
jgi:hypothetical protein